MPNVYVLVLLRDTTFEHGPWTFLPRACSQIVGEKLGYWKRGKPYRVSDEEVYSVADRSQAIEFAYPRGTVLFIESSGCFHYGSRNSVIPRFQLMYAYTGAPHGFQRGHHDTSSVSAGQLGTRNCEAWCSTRTAWVFLKTKAMVPQAATGLIFALGGSSLAQPDGSGGGNKSPRPISGGGEPWRRHTRRGRTVDRDKLERRAASHPRSKAVASGDWQPDYEELNRVAIDLRGNCTLESGARESGSPCSCVTILRSSRR